MTITPEADRGDYKVFISRPAEDTTDCGTSTNTVVGYAGRWGQW